MGFVRRAWPVIAPWVRSIFIASVRLGLYPHRLKSSNAIPTHKPAKKDKTSPKAYRPVEQHAEVLAKPLERLMANRITFEAESRGLLQESQFGGRSGRSTQQAASAFIHRARAHMDDGMIVSTLFFDLKGAFNGISHRVVAEELAACGFSRTTIAWVLAFLDGHRVTIVIDGKGTVTFRCTGRGAPQGSGGSLRGGGDGWVFLEGRLRRRCQLLDGEPIHLGEREAPGDGGEGGEGVGGGGRGAVRGRED
jgi:hypothetical protein